ncbi:MAG: SPOR domain-containing protein [Saprospiraceae bacterium]
MKTLFFMICTTLIVASSGAMKSFLYTSNSFEEAKEISKETNKPLLIYFTSESCNVCQSMNESTFEDDYLIHQMNDKYVTVVIDCDQEESINFIKEYKILNFPTFQIIGTDGIMGQRIEESISDKDFYEYLNILYTSSESPVKSEKKSPKMASTLNFHFTPKTIFKPGRVEVNEGTYEELQAHSVNPSSAFINAQKERSANSSIVERKEELNTNDAESVNNNIAKKMIGILEEVDENGIEKKGRAVTEMTQKTPNREDIKFTKVSDAEEVKVMTISRKEARVNSEIIDNAKYVSNDDASSISNNVNYEAWDKKSKEETLRNKIEYIQAGAFKSEKNAEKLHNRLQKYGSEIIIIESSENKDENQQLFRVLLGPFEFDSQKEKALHVLSKHGITGFAVRI